MADRIQNGDTFENVIKNAPKWLPRADRYFLVAAAETGSLPRTLQNLADRHNHIGATQLKVVLGLLYPLAIFHLAALLLPLTGMIDYESGFQWNAASFVGKVLMIVVPVWLLLALIYYLSKSAHPLLPRLLRCLPLLKKYSERQALADLSYSIGTFIGAGVPAPTAWRTSARIVNDPRFIEVVAQLEPTFAIGGDPSEELKRFKCFPPEFGAFYKSGATSGKLDSNLLRCGENFQVEANTAMTLAAMVYPSLLLALIAAFIISVIFNVFGDYLDFFDTLSA